MRHTYSPEYPGAAPAPPPPAPTPVPEQVSPVAARPSGGWPARADLVTNGSFEEWDGDIPVGWHATNAWPEEAKVHTGRYAVRLGLSSGPASTASTAPTASLAQVARVSVGTVYQLAFSALGTGDTPRPVEVMWLDETGQPAGETIPPILLPPVVLPQFAQYTRIIGPAPATARFVQLRFSKTGAGYLVIDDVSLFRLY